MLTSLSSNEAKDLLLFSFRYVLERSDYDVPEWIDLFYKFYPYTSDPGRSYLIQTLNEEIQAYLNQEWNIHRFNMKYSWDKFTASIFGKLRTTKKTVKSSEIRSILWFGFQYVLGRSTCAPSYWIEMFNKLQSDMEDKDRRKLRCLILKELDLAFQERSNLGDECDRVLWSQFRNRLREESNAKV